ncbi:methyltransferase [Candidatus Endobugula sertula]|uniref:protein-glutamate O-methyltransferase n=1 Tax=Candidatus Endobugula sertula TaxID=62101 RepID=A0A1D2QSL6_9GAMM|nr:methyltransferase [Candidatus Endobugula sertula]
MSWSFKKFDVLPEGKFLLWEKLLELRTGIQLAPQQKILLQTQIAIRMRELNISSYDEYYEQVKRNDKSGLVEWQVLVDRLVVKETTFFRHRPSLEYVRQHLKNTISQRDAEDSFDIWSVGCSTGEEPYGLAMIANDCMEESQERFYFGVTAIDVSLPALSVARRGIYKKRSMSFLTDVEREKYFLKQSDGQFEVVSQLKKRVCFSQANINSLSVAPIQKMDVIYCQNVLIYFRRWRRREILNQLVERLKLGGLLIIGLGETTDWRHLEVQRVDNDEVQAYIKSV